MYLVDVIKNKKDMKKETNKQKVSPMVKSVNALTTGIILPRNFIADSAITYSFTNYLH